MPTLHLVSHTHWDREWYLTFQQFRLKLVHMVDNLLALLASDPDYKYFMLDGQTIVLDDYLLMRPEREKEIRAHVQSGRLLIGPWHILPDEFLVSPEATVRNLLQGGHTACRFGLKMPVGYIPDPFGHIGQMPQILRGFGIEVAAFRRGLSDEPCEVWWQAPDGSRVLAAYLRDGYDNAARLPVLEPDRFVSEVCRLRDSLAPHAATGHILLMHGTDHMEPPPNTTSVLAYAQGKLGHDTLIHSTLPAYFAAIQPLISNPQSPIPTIIGELRDSKRHHLLPGVLSTRMWIKQRNHACETLLEKWAEPFSAWVQVESEKWKVEGEKDGQRTWVATGHQKTDRIGAPAPIVRQAWRLLMECHPHDSICGCSIDQVHDEMRARFDQVEQIGEEITRQSLEALATTINTAPSPISNPQLAIIALNPVAGPRTDLVTLPVQAPAGTDAFEIADQAGNVLPHQTVDGGSREIANMALDKNGLRSMLGIVQEGQIVGMVISDVGFRREGSTLVIDIVMTDSGEPDAVMLKAGMAEIEKSLADETLSTYAIRVRSAAATTVSFVARDVPGYGYRTFWMRPHPTPPLLAGEGREGVTLLAGADREGVENEFLAVQASPEDGTLTVTDKRTGAVYRGLNRFVDGGDCGDEYNYSPPATECWGAVAGPAQVAYEYGEAQQSITVSLTLLVPAELAQDRRSRSAEKIPLDIVTRATLTAGVPRVDIVTEVDNSARDHRLRVHFPAPFVATAADHDGHFEVVRRPVGLPAFDGSWVEQPRPEAPQRAWTDISDGAIGLMIANRGLPEVQVLTNNSQSPIPNLYSPTSEIVLTLLRCAGWLSRDDFPTRKGHAGPPWLATPGAQMMGHHHFEYAIIPHSGDWQSTLQAYQQGYAFGAPMRAVATSPHAGSLPGANMVVRVEPAGFILSAVKLAQDGHGLIVRGYNVGAEAMDVTLTPWRKFARAAQVRLDEQEQALLAQAGDGGVSLAVRGHEIVTVRFQ